MERKFNCLRCGTELECLGRKALEGGLGLVNSLDVEVYECPSCHKLEFYNPIVPMETEKRFCPVCKRLVGNEESVCRICGAALPRL